MKLYYFEPGSYDVFYIVMSSSRERALQVLKQHLLDGSGRDSFWQAEYERWRKATLDNLPDDFTLKEYGEDEVFEAEWS